MRYEQEVDTKLAALLEEAAKTERDLEWAASLIHEIAGDRRNHSLPHRPWVKPFAECLAYAMAHPEGWANGTPAPRAVKVYEVARTAYKAKEAEVKAQEALYTGWSRFFLVLNPDGHIHSSRSCSTCQWDTRFGWLPDVSGLTEAEAVAAHGERLCTVCFPSAPVEWCEGYKSQTKKAVAARRAEAQAKRDAKAAKNAAYWADRHYAVRHTRADGSVWVSGFDNEYDVKRHGARPKGKTLKAALRDAKEYDGYNGSAVAIDLLTGEEAK